MGLDTGWIEAGETRTAFGWFGAPVDKLLERQRDALDETTCHLTWVPSLMNCDGTSASSLARSDIVDGVVRGVTVEGVVKRAGFWTLAGGTWHSHGP